MLKRWALVQVDDFLNKHAQVSGRTAQTMDMTLEQQQKVGIPLAALSEEWMARDKRVESDMYPIFCNAFNKVAEVVSSESKWTFKDISASPESGLDDENLKIDLAMYPTEIPDAVKAYEATPASSRASAQPEHCARTAWAWMAVAVKIKCDSTDTAFLFDEVAGQEFFCEKGALATSARVQLIKCAGQLMLRQHRRYVFIIYVWRNKARLTRWDRAGCIVSSTIDLLTQPLKLLNFVYRLCCMTRVELGYDETAVLASKANIEAFEAYSSLDEWAQDYARDITSNKILYPIYRISCLDVNGEDGREYLVGKHLAGSSSPTGRATKGFIAFDLKERRLRFLKDSWRPNSNKVHFELDVYKVLHEGKAEYVATALGGGNVFGNDGAIQRTVAQDYLGDSDEVPLERYHCRLVLADIARPLDSYESSIQLMGVLRDALLGHYYAWTLAGILHRDVSVNNIMILIDQDRTYAKAKCRGILIDWDLCKFKAELTQGSKQPGRAGTWAFMSALSLGFPFKPTELADDLESFVHVLTYCVTRFHRTSLTDPEYNRKKTYQDMDLIKLNSQNSRLSRYVHMFYMQRDDHGPDPSSGGGAKLDAIFGEHPGFHMPPEVHHLWSLIINLYRILQKHYKMIDMQSLREYRIVKVMKPWSVATVEAKNLPKVRAVQAPKKAPETLASPSSYTQYPATSPSTISEFVPRHVSANVDAAAVADAPVTTVRPNNGVGATEKSTSDSTTNGNSGAGLQATFGSVFTPYGDHSLNSKHSSPSLPYAASIGQRTLDTHHEILTLFCDAVIDLLGKIQNKYPVDKLHDQFLGLEG